MAEAISVQLAVAPEQKPAKLNGHNGHHAKAEPAATLSAPVASEILVEAAVEPPVEPVVPVVSAPQVAAPVGAAAESTSLSDAVQKALKGGRMIHADTGSTDLAAYVARAKANGRSLESVCGGEGMNTAADGEQFWGPVDNESSRAKASGKVLTIDQFECIACGTCVEQTDKVFYLPNEAKATPIAQDGPMDLIQDAIDECPVTCISWVPTEEAAERGLATGAEYLE
jgi:ferredoxin